MPAWGATSRPRSASSCGRITTTLIEPHAGPLRRSPASARQSRTTRDRPNETRPRTPGHDAWRRSRACAPSPFRCSGNVDRADDLVQETLLRALANINSFQPGTNMSAWLFTILRNLFRSEYRKRRREVEDSRRQLRRDAEVAARADQPRRVRGIPRRARQAALRPARSADPGRRLRLLLRGGGRDLRLRGRHDQEPRQPRAHPARQLLLDRQPQRLRPRSARPAPCSPATTARPAHLDFDLLALNFR